MGVRGLQSFLKQSHSTAKSIEDLLLPKNAKLRIGVDISYYIYKWQGSVDKILAFLRLLESNKHRIVLAFDGRAEEGKQWEAQRRRAAREEELKSAQVILTMLESPPDGMTEEERKALERTAQEHQRKGWSLTREMRQTLKQRFYEERVPMLKAKGEADGLLAAMSSCDDLDLVISGDMDLLAMGAKVLWTPVGDGYQFREYNREVILSDLKLSDYQFRSMCAMCFTEASETVNSIDIQRAYHSMKIFRSITAIQKKYPTWLEVWPNDSHIFYRSVDTVQPWLREDQEAIYKAFVQCDPMPYH
jgi:5'-3' exonuclease